MPGAAAAAMRPLKRKRGGGQHPAPSPTPSPRPLPLDILLEIASRSNPTTLARCAATCKDLRRSIADDGAASIRRRLHHADDRFVRSLVGGLLVRERKNQYWLFHASCWRTPSPPLGLGALPLRERERPVAARDGLLLVRVRVAGKKKAPLPAAELRMYSAATGRCQTLPPGPTRLRGKSVLLVGDDGEHGVIGRSFKVLNAKLVLSNFHLCLRIQTFSSELGAWGRRTRIPIPFIPRSTSLRLLRRPLVFNDAVHWLCSTKNSYYYILTLHVAIAQVTLTKLPDNIPCSEPGQLLLATSSVGGSPIVLVADGTKISAWSRAASTGMWKKRPQLMIKNDAIILQLNKKVGGGMMRGPVRLEWFGERSGVVLVRLPNNGGFCWLDLQTKEIIHCFTDKWTAHGKVYVPYEDLSTWSPTFCKTF